MVATIDVLTDRRQIIRWYSYEFRTHALGAGKRPDLSRFGWHTLDQGRMEVLAPSMGEPCDMA